MPESDYGLILGLIISDRARSDIAQALLAGTEDVAALAAAASVTEDVALRHLGRFQSAGAVRPTKGLRYRLTKTGRLAAADAFQPIPPFRPR